MKQADLLKAISSLTPYQKRKLKMYILDALQLNEESINTCPTICPYCNQKRKMIKKGFKCRKQRYQCKAWDHVFTFNSHTITMYSKIERSQFNQILLDTLNCVSIKKNSC